MKVRKRNEKKNCEYPAAAITLLCALPFTVPAYAAVTEDYKLQPGGTYYFRSVVL